MTTRPASLLFTRPADEWYDALPLGNGSIGAMVYGGVREERIYFSEGTFWSGEPAPEENVVDGAALVAEIRRELVAAGPKAAASPKAGAADALERAHELAAGLQGRMLNYGTNLPFGTIRLAAPDSGGAVADYSRRLDLDRAVARVRYRRGDTTITREAFVSHPDQVLVVRIAADRPAGVTVRVSLDGHEQPYHTERAGDGRLVMTTLARELVHSDGTVGVTGTATLAVRTAGGTLTPQADHVLVRGADEVHLVMAAATSMASDDPAGLCDRRVDAALAKRFQELLDAHVADHRELFGRAGLVLGATDPGAATTTGGGRGDQGDGEGEEAPIEELVRRARDGDGDLRLFELQFQFGRYLLIGASRPDSTLPAHLTGAWNDNVACRMGWTCDYHLDINTQMNYWLAELTNVPECSQPLFRWIEERLVPSGRVTARKLYGSPGWVAHVVSNAWGYSAPGWSVGWGFHITGGVWVALHLWDRYRFSADVDFLRETAYPILREAAEFFADHLFEHPDLGYLVTGPTYSPENHYLVDGRRFTLTLGPTVDSVLLRELFSACLEAQRVLGAEDELGRTLADAIGRLPPLRAGESGRLMEWLYDYEEALPHHRHTSHLLALYPFSQITPDGTPELARAARASVEGRENAPGGFEEGAWARNNFSGFYARLGDGEAAYRSLLTLFTSAGDRSLMAGTTIAPLRAYEMDYNTGATAAIAEMLVQSRTDAILILPALPPAWPDGSAFGLCARGGFVVSLAWRDGKPTRVSVHSRAGGPCVVRLPGAADGIAFDTVAGGDYDVVPGLARG